MKGRVIYANAIEMNSNSINNDAQEDTQLTSHSPAHNTQAIDHGGVGVSTHQGVREQQLVAIKHNPRQVLQVHLEEESILKTYIHAS